MNLGIEYFGALVIAPFIFGAVLLEEEHKSIITIVIMSLMVFLAYGIASLLFYLEKSAISPVWEIGGNFIKIQNVGVLFGNICNEILSTIPTALCLIVYFIGLLLRRMIAKASNFSILNMISLVVILVIICVLALVFYALVLDFPENFQGLDETIVISTIGAVATAIVISDVVIFNAHMFWVIAIVTFFIVIGVLVGLDEGGMLFNRIYLSEAGAITLSSELVGALSSGVLLQRFIHKQ